MKFLQVATLSAILVEYATASNDSGAKFYCAVKKGILATAVELYEQDKSLGKHGIDYVVEESNSKFIAKFINQTGQANDRTLSKLCHERPVEVIRKVLRKVDFPQKDLVKETAHHASQCHIEKVLVLLEKIETPERQESVVESSIGHVLYRCSTDDFYSFLNALKRKSLLSERLENDTTQSAFKEGVRRNHADLQKRTFDQPAITPEIYADGLIAYDQHTKHLMFQWLLERADRDDLVKVQGRYDYNDMMPEFRAAIDEALKTAQPGGTRTHDNPRALRRAEEIFEELGYFQESEEPVDLISAYLGVNKPTPRRKAKEAAKQAANWIRLREAIDRRELETAVKLYKRDKLLHHKGMDYVIEQQFPEFIVSFVKHAYETSGYIPDTLCKKCSKETVETVLEKVNFSQHDLVEVASSQELMCEPEKFIVLVNKIREPERQESVVESSIGQLILHSRFEYLIPMLDALKDKIFRSEHLEVIAIRIVFKAGVKFNREDLLKRTVEDQAITPGIYADALIESEKSWESSKLTREWLLKGADRDDLQAVNDNGGYADLILPFRTAIENAWETAKPGGTRTRAYDIQSAKKTKEEFMEIDHAVAIAGIAKIIGEYLAGAEEDEMEVGGVLQKQEEDVEMGVVDEEEWGEGGEEEEGEEEEWGNI